MQNDVMAFFLSISPRWNSELVPQWGLVWYNLKGHARLCLTEARVPSFNGEKADLKPSITSFYMYFYVIPSFSPLKSGTRASLRHESDTALKVVTDEASLRHEFRVSTGRNPRKSIKNPPLRHFACFLRHNIAFLPVETRNSCLSEAAGTTSSRRPETGHKWWLNEESQRRKSH